MDLLGCSLRPLLRHLYGDSDCSISMGSGRLNWGAYARAGLRNVATVWMISVSSKSPRPERYLLATTLLSTIPSPLLVSRDFF